MTDSETASNVKQEETPKIMAVEKPEKVKGFTRVAAGKRLSQISKKAKERRGD